MIDERYDRRDRRHAVRAGAWRDVEKRGQILLQAENIALGDHAWITRNFRANRTIVRPYIKGWIANARDVNRTRWLSIDEAARAAAGH